MVDCSGASVTPRGFSVTDETLERTEVSEAAHRTPPRKGRWRNGNQPPHLANRSFASDMIHEMAASIQQDSHFYKLVCLSLIWVYRE